MYVISLIIGAVLGFVGSKVLFVGSALSLIPWAIAGFIIGYFSKTKKLALFNGGVFGFALGFIFMIAGYTGTASLVSRIPFFALIGIFCAVCGAIVSVVGSFSRKVIKK